MSDVAIGNRAIDHRTGGGAFRPLTVALLLGVGILGFIGSLLLGAFAPDLRSGRNAGSHALSNAATGYAGLVELLRATGRDPRILRDEEQWDTPDLVVVTPERAAADMSRILEAREDNPTLIVLPKWATVADADTKGWVDVTGLLPASEPIGVLAPGTMLGVVRHRSGGRPLRPVGAVSPALAVAAPRPVQAIRPAPLLVPLLTDDAGGIVLARFGRSNQYVLTDPDLLSNHGLRRLDRARAALALLAEIAPDGAVTFDVTVNGLGRSRSPLKLMFELPFLAMTIAIGIALALVGWQALARFGAPRPRERAIAFGKAALIDNTAALVRKAGREASLGGRYAAMIRDRARGIFGVPAALQDAEAAAYLDRLHGSVRFTTLADAAARADNRDDVLAAAQALHQWQWEKTE